MASTDSSGEAALGQHVDSSPRALLHLPGDLLRAVVSHLEGSCLARCACTCHALRSTVEDDQLWAVAIRRRWGWLIGCGGRPSGGGWREYYVQLHGGASARFVVVGVSAPTDLQPGDLSSVRQMAAHYKVQQGTWQITPGLLRPLPRSMASVLRDDGGALVIVGGMGPVRSGILERHVALNVVERLSDGHTWDPLPSLQEARCCAGAVNDGRGSLWCLGGGESMYSHSRTLCSVERLLWQPPEQAATGLSDGTADGPMGGGWRFGPPMGECRCAFGCAVGLETQHIVAAGGYGGDHRYLDSAELLDLTGDGRWVGLPRLSCKRSGCAAAAGPDRRIYVIGGGPDGRGQHRSMEALDVRAPSWDTSLAPARVGRHYNAAAFGPDGRLYCSGAFRHEGQLDVVERYDPRADRWEDLPDVGIVIGFSAGAFLF